MLHTSKEYYQVATGNTLLYLLSLWNPPSCWQAVAASSGLKRRLQTVPQALLMQTSTLPSLVKFSGLSLPTSLRSPVVQFPGNVVEGSRNIWRCSFNSQSINACYTRIFQDSHRHYRNTIWNIYLDRWHWHPQTGHSFSLPHCCMDNPAVLFHFPYKPNYQHGLAGCLQQMANCSGQ